MDLKNKIIPYNTQYTDKEDIDAIVDLFNSEDFNLWTKSFRI